MTTERANRLLDDMLESDSVMLSEAMVEEAGGRDTVVGLALQ